MRRFVLRLCAFALATALAAPAAAQSVWLDRDHRSSVLVETLFPDYDGTDTGFPTWTWFVGARLPVGRTLWIEAELPYTRAEFQSEFTDVSGSKIGNPYVGIEIAPKPDRGVRFELGLRAPVIGDTSLGGDDLAAVLNGIYADVDRREAFVPELLPIHTGIRYHQSALATHGGVGFDVRFTPEIWIPVGEDNSDAETEIVLGYLGTVQYALPDVRVGAGFTGAWDASGDGDFDQDSSHQIELMADFLKGPVRPGLQLKVPLDSGPFDFVNFTWGFTLNILPGYSP